MGDAALSANAIVAAVHLVLIVIVNLTQKI
jgi:hypothetical protein